GFLHLGSVLRRDRRRQATVIGSLGGVPVTVLRLLRTLAMALLTALLLGTLLTALLLRALLSAALLLLLRTRRGSAARLEAGDDPLLDLAVHELLDRREQRTVF